jgi:hypothetical protein
LETLETLALLVHRGCVYDSYNWYHFPADERLLNSPLVTGCYVQGVVEGQAEDLEVEVEVDGLAGEIARGQQQWKSLMRRNCLVEK